MHSQELLLSDSRRGDSMRIGPHSRLTTFIIPLASFFPPLLAPFSMRLSTVSLRQHTSVSYWSRRLRVMRPNKSFKPNPLRGSA